jgi:hypothetical protein
MPRMVSSLAPARASTVDVTMRHVVPGAYQLGVWNSILFARWERSADAIGISHLDEISKSFRTAHPTGRQSGIHIVLEGVGLPTPEARAGLMRLMKTQADQIAAIAVVICGSGFAAGAIRSFLTGLRLAAPRSFDFRVHSRTSDVLAWLPEAHNRQTGEDIKAAQLERALTPFAAGQPFT